MATVLASPVKIEKQMSFSKPNISPPVPLRVKPLVLLVLDGWGYSENPQCNAIFSANKPNWDYLWDHYAHTLIEGSGKQVGLPDRQMGNSEVGHLNLGAGRVVHQEFTRIDKAIAEDEFRRNNVLLDAVQQAVASDKAVHILGLLSPGGVHSHENQLQAMVELAAEKGARKLFFHAFLDGRDTPPKSAAASLKSMSELFARLGCGRLASIIGRYYAMDRDNRWPRVKLAYDLICHGISEFQASDALSAIEQAYERGETDEFIKATAIIPEGGQAARLADGDVVIFMNFRADRARELSHAFVDEHFSSFDRGAPPRLGEFVSLTEYSKDLNIPVAFPPTRLRNVFAEYISKLGLHQLRVAETEKYAHVTFFFNGGVEQAFAGEERTLIPSPKVSTYDQQPEMSAVEVTDTLLAAIGEGRFDVIICNYANPDMVGHTGNFEAAVTAIETIDTCLGRLYEVIRKAGGEMLITADHGNAEQMSDPATGQPHTAHTSNPVPLIYVGRRAEMRTGGALSDVAPTMLMLMGLDKPPEMEGSALVTLSEM